ncbi:MAG: hypothetical protein OXH57_12610 [Ekhidna sp.]|nr:hypothetical protein [Ekhidna sp.]
MNQDQINRLEMYQTTLDYLDANNAVWNTIPIIGKYKNALSTINTSIKTAAADQANARVFIGKSLSALKKTIASKMDILDDMLEAYAVDTDNAELTQRANNAKSDYFRLPNEDFEIKVKQVIGLLETHLKAMADYGMSEEQLKDVKLDYDQFLVLRGKPRSYRVASSAATQDLATLFREGTIATEKLDRVMKRYRRANANFYNGYVAARRVVDS